MRAQNKGRKALPTSLAFVLLIAVIGCGPSGGEQPASSEGQLEGTIAVSGAYLAGDIG